MLSVRFPTRSLITFAVTLTALLFVAISASCISLFRPAARSPHQLHRPDGTTVVCYEPPAEVVPSAVRARVDAKIPDVIEVLEAQLEIEETLVRIRSDVHNLQAVEALEFRLCAAWAQGVLSEELYREFLFEVLPLLREACRAPTDHSETTSLAGDPP